MNKVLPKTNLILITEDKPDALIINTGEQKSTVIPIDDR